MAGVKSVTVEHGMSVELQGVWYKYGCTLTVGTTIKDDIGKVKEMAWNTVVTEVDKQVRQTIADLGMPKV